MQEELVSIPVDGGQVQLAASIFSSEGVTGMQTPWIVILHGLGQHRKGKFVNNFTGKFVEAGYHVLAYDGRGHGETAKQTGKNWFALMDKIYGDLKHVIDWIIETQDDRILDEKLALFGRSLGGAMILTWGFKDSRARALIALCTRHDYASIFRPEKHADLIYVMSPKYFLEKLPENNDRILIAHCKDDEQIPYEPNLRAIQEQLALSDENVITYETGGHSFKGNRENIFKVSLEFLKKYL